MLDDIKNTINSLEEMKNVVDNSSLNAIDNILSELNNIKIILSPTKLTISSNATNLTSVMSGTIKCSFSVAPGSYMSIRATMLTSNLPSSNITDSKLGVNILPFAGCTNPANPTMNPFVFPWVCIPLLTPFIPTNPTMLLQNAPITTINSKAICNFAAGGVVGFINSGQINVKTS